MPSDEESGTTPATPEPAGRGGRTAANGPSRRRSLNKPKDEGAKLEPPVPAAPAKPMQYVASIFSFPPVLPDEFVQKVRELEDALDQEVWLVVQGGPLPKEVAGRIDFQLWSRFTDGKDHLPKPEKVNVNGQSRSRSRLAVLIHSPGGQGEPAYRLASLFQRQCGGFTAVVPAMAKSAATLLTLGADAIFLGEDGELGPLDAQIYDPDVAEDWVSALDEVQAVEALEASAIETAYRVMVYLHDRTEKTYNVLLPHAMHFAAEITKPLFEKIDAVRYSRQSRRLQEAQDYAERLLTNRRKFTDSEAKAIARDLVRNYPTHEFVIDRREAKLVGKIDGKPPVGLPVEHAVDGKINSILDWFYVNLSGIRAIGRIVEKPAGGKKE